MKKSFFILLLLSSCDGFTAIYNNIYSEKENNGESYEISKNDEKEKIEKIKEIINHPIEREFSEIDNSHNLSKKYIKNLLQKGDSIKILDTKYIIKRNSIIKVTTEYRLESNTNKRMRLIAEFDRNKKILTKVVFHNQI